MLGGGGFLPSTVSVPCQNPSTLMMNFPERVMEIYGHQY